MKKCFAIIVLLLVFGLHAEAGGDYGFGYKKPHSKNNSPVIGLKLGYTSYAMTFSDEYYNNLPMTNLQKPGFGLFLEVPFRRVPCFSIGLEFLMVERGMTKTFTFRQKIKENDQIDAKYIDVRVPLTCYFFNDYAVNPYIFAAADLALCFGGTMSKEFPNGECENKYVDIAKSDAVISPYDFSVLAGIGLRFKLNFTRFVMPIKIECDYNLGLLNNMSKVEGTPIDVYAYSFEPSERKSHGVEFMISIGIPLKFKTIYDACRSWK